MAASAAWTRQQSSQELGDIWHYYTRTPHGQYQSPPNEPLAILPQRPRQPGQLCQGASHVAGMPAVNPNLLGALHTTCSVISHSAAWQCKRGGQSKSALPKCHLFVNTWLNPKLLLISGQSLLAPLSVSSDSTSKTSPGSSLTVQSPLPPQQEVTAHTSPADSLRLESFHPQCPRCKANKQNLMLMVFNHFF